MAAETFLHGVEVIEIDDGIRPIRTVRSSVIGVVGTAPNSAPEVKASLAIGTVSSNNALTLTATAYGMAGNAVSISVTKPTANNAALAVTVVDKKISISLATGATGLATTTAAQLKTAYDAVPAAVALATCAPTGASTGAGIVAPLSRSTFLAGGTDEPFPLNKPVLVAGDLRETAKLGTEGTLPEAAKGIFAQTGAVVVFVRVETGNDEAATIQNVIGGIDNGTGDYKGIYAFLGAESVIGFCPRILIAPGFTHQYTTGANAVVAELQGIANRLRAVVIADGPNTNDAAAIAAIQNYGNKRVYFHDVFYTVLRDGEAVNVPASPYIAGLIARVDNELGFWNSPSNKEIYGIIGTARPIDFTLGDSNSRANLLNERNVATTIRKDGFRLWGNRTASADPKWAFLSVTRTSDMVNESILRAHMWAVDRNITRTYYEDVSEGVNAYLSRLQAQGAIIGGKCWADKAFNKPADIQDGHATFSVDFTAPYPAERITFRSMLVNDYLEEIL